MTNDANTSTNELLRDLLNGLESENNDLANEIERLNNELKTTKRQNADLRVQLQHAKQEETLRAYMTAREKREDQYLSKLRTLQSDLLSGHQRILEEQKTRQSVFDSWETAQHERWAAQQSANERAINAMDRVDSTVSRWNVRWSRVVLGFVLLTVLSTSLALGTAYLIVRNQPHRVMSKEHLAAWNQKNSNATYYDVLMRSVSERLNDNEHTIWSALCHKALGKTLGKNEKYLLQHLPSLNHKGKAATSKRRHRRAHLKKRSKTASSNSR